MHGDKENDIRDAGGEYSQKQEEYRKLFTRGPLIIVGLILLFGSYKLVSDAVKRADNLHVVFVVLAFPLFALGCAAFLYVIGFFDALWH